MWWLKSDHACGASGFFDGFLAKNACFAPQVGGAI
jgi:hypothetical protein